MKVIGGYFSSAKEKINPEHIRSKILSFQPFSNPEFRSNLVTIEEYEYGHLFASQRDDVRSMVTAAKNGKDLFFCLGYLTMNNFEDWDGHRQTFRMPPHVPENFGEQLTGAEGEFNAFYWDERRKQLNIVNDRFAARPLYMAQTGNGVFFCTNLPLLLQLAKTPVKLDPLGVMQLFLYLHPVDNFTQVESVKRLRPASRMTLSESGASCKPYWKLRYDVDYDLDPRKFSQEVFSAFRKSVADRARVAQHGVLALSGGLDSRFIAACMPEPGRFGAFTVGSYNCEEDLECKCAAEISRVYGFSHKQILLAPSDLPGFSREIFMLLGNVTGLHAVAKFIRFPQTENECGFSGAPGDVMAGGYIPGLFCTLPSRTQEFISQRTVLNHECINTMRRFLSPGLVDEYAPKMENVLKETYANASGPTAAHKLTAWKMVHYIPAFSCSGPFNSHPVACRFYPHLGYAYNDLLLKLPAAWIYNKAFYKYMIYHELPQIRHVCYANTGKLLTDSLPLSSLSWVDYKLWALKRRYRSMLRRKETTQPQQAFEFHVMQENQKLWDDMEEIISSYPELNTFLNVTSIKDYIGRFRQLNPQEQLGTLDCITKSSFLSAVLYFVKYAHELK